MGLEYAHKGYEYQDLLSALFITEKLLTSDIATFKIDKKESKNDKFDDITIISTNGILKRQIKYSEEKILQKADLSSVKYDLALDILFNSWLETIGPQTIDLRICLAWEYIENNEELDFLEEVDCYNLYNDENVKFLKINIDSIWESGQLPKTSWRRLRSQAKNIKREDFAAFLNDLIIEVNLPKASHDIANPAALESLVISKLKKFGVGKYPNHQKSVGDVLLNLTHIVKSSRARGEEISLTTIVYRLGLKNDFGNIQHNFFVDKELNVINEFKYQNFNDFIFNNQKTILIGQPGSGKSWFLQNFIDFLKTHSIKSVQHYCYTGVDDLYEKERITINVFLANLINDIINVYPDLAEYKSTKYGVDLEELQTLLNNIKEKTVFIIDGLDHIGRIYNFHKSIIKEVDTEIINVLSKLEFPENIRVVLASQPIAEVVHLTDDRYEIFEVVPWDVSDTEKLLENNGFKDVNLDWNIKLSDLLMKKSNGNPLYLTYLINELKDYSPSVISIDLIESFPPYNNNLANYYDYIMSKIPDGQKVPQILSGTPFYLSEKELIEITHLGQYVGQSLEAIQSILKFNTSNGGYTVYHESFRRYILESLEKKEVNVEMVIYNDLIEWLKKKGFYRDRKSYLNLLVLLFESKRFEEIITYCNKEFVVESIYYGNNISSLKHNFEILIKTACLQQDYGSLIVCTELSNMIYSLEFSFDENSELYYQGLGLINGFDTIKDTLLYEGHMALGLNEGLKVCFLCSTNDIVPEWEPYISLLVESRKADSQYRNNSDNELEMYKYYICACLDMGWEMAESLSKICGKEAFDYRKTVIAEYYRRDLVDDLNVIINEIPNNEYWKKSISDYFSKSIIDESLITKTFETLLVSDSYSEETMSFLKFYVGNIKWIIQHRENELNGFIGEIKERNWYYNWLIFIAEVNRVLLVRDLEEKDFESGLCDAYLWLIKDLEPFKGNPRTCDLFKYESMIYETIRTPMAYIKTKDTWRRILETVTIMSQETMTLFQGATGGPLPTYRLLNLFVQIANDENIQLLLEIFNEKIEREDKYRYYSYLADYSFKHAIILSKVGKEEAKHQFKQGVKYLLSYSFRKDRTFSHLLESVESTYNVNNEIGLQNILKLKPLADAVVYHTDGKSTKTYQYEWFEVLANIDINIALMYLKNELTSYISNWILEDSLEYLLITCNSKISPTIENAIYRTFPNNTSETFIESYVKNIECLIENEFLLQARRSVAELMSRFGAEVNISNYYLASRIKKLCQTFDIEWNDSIYSFSIKAERNYYDRKFKIENSGVSRLSIDEFSNEDLLVYISQNGIKTGDLQGVYYFLNRLKKLDDESKAFLSSFVKSCFDRRSDDPTRKRLIELIHNIELDNEMMAFIYMHMFLVHTDGWYNRFTKIELFRKAHEYNSQVAEKHFFEFIYNNLYTVDYSLAVGGKIIKSLTAINYDNQSILDYWDRLFDIINFRLPGQIDYDWNPIINKSTQLDNVEKLLLLLLTRLKYGESNRYKWIISDLNNLLEIEEVREKFANPFIQFLNEREQFIDYSLIMLLILVKESFSYKELKSSGILDSIESLFHIENPIINYLTEVIFGKRKNRLYLDYKYKYNYTDKRTNYFIDRMKKIDTRLSLLDRCGVDIGQIIYNYTNKIFSKEFTTEFRDILYNGKYSVLTPNVYFYDILTYFMGNEVDVYLNSHSGEPHFQDIEEKMFSIVLDDIALIIAQNNSIIPRPKDLKLPEVIENCVTDVEKNDWIRIAYHEKWFCNLGEYKDNFGDSCKTVTILSGIGFKGTDLLIPFLELSDKYNLFDENYYEKIIFGSLTKLDVFLTTNAKLLDDPYLTYKEMQYLGVRSEVLYLLGITMLENNNGIVGVTEVGEEVIKYSRWDVCFYDSNSDSSRFPYLVGSQLLMKESKFNELCSLVDKKPYLYTNRIV